jgi:4,5-DOPA dioxygenase extradiol
MNAIQDNVWSRGFRSLARLLPRPRAILAVSAHWYVPGTFLTGNDRPETIHDFGGFPRPLYEMQYPAPGDPDLAARIVRLLGEETASLATDWGLDHGSWSVLHHLVPAADLPVVQLSLDLRLPPAAHLEIGKRLRPLREEGVLVLGSGNITHNLRHAMGSAARGETDTPPWAREFDELVARAVEQHDGALLAAAVESETGRRCHPTLDHYLPLLYVVAASEPGDRVEFPITGFDLSSLSMRAAILTGC